MSNYFELLKTIPDPEIPVIDIVELGIVRGVNILENGVVEVVITPTYSACPAMFNIEEDIVSLFNKNKIPVKVTTQMFPVWTTEWLTEEAREKLRNYGIVPPEKGHDENHLKVPIRCPRCNSTHTRMISRFGSTLCKASYQCNDCLEPFDYFKCH
ncbi:MAG: phenylacetate-CoA oxygenase subunit PaaJ [Bacteroidetes bacterium]|nr:phenylacetate-CoA oxygenase subunit PaaJ [Bacteroidota bacterium]